VYRDYGVIPKDSRDDNFNRTPDNVDKYLSVHPGDLVVNRMKAWQGSLGVSPHSGVVSPDYEVLRPTGSALLPQFAHLYLRSLGMITQYRVRSTGIRPAQWRLYWEDMGSIKMVVPSLADQEAFVTALDRAHAASATLIGKSDQFIALSKERRAALITAAVSGHLGTERAA
jgi:type I restriction enzyme S subunit